MSQTVREHNNRQSLPNRMIYIRVEYIVGWPFSIVSHGSDGKVYGPDVLPLGVGRVCESWIGWNSVRTQHTTIGLSHLSASRSTFVLPNGRFSLSLGYQSINNVGRKWARAKPMVSSRMTWFTNLWRWVHVSQLEKRWLDHMKLQCTILPI